ncbi:metallophosphatase family protein [Candidatus Bipolaricaulota bacterium]|nr:metallophosphatase family protein [Candidatus Bipolaricaulota bacterium]
MKTRIAILSDIHGNLAALEAVLAAIDTQQVKQILCCGDIIGYGPHPAQCIRLLQDADACVVQGNHDAAVADLLNHNSFSIAGKLAVEWTATAISDAERNWLAELPLIVRTDRYVLFHGSLRDPLWEYITTSSTAYTVFMELEGDLAFFGHSHLAGAFMFMKEQSEISYRPGGEERLEIENKTQYLINPGSVGQPRDGDPRAAFAIAELAENEKWVQFYRIDYDIEQTRRAIIAARLPQSNADRLLLGI